MIMTVDDTIACTGAIDHVPGTRTYSTTVGTLYDLYMNMCHPPERASHHRTTDRGYTDSLTERAVRSWRFGCPQNLRTRFAICFCILPCLLAASALLRPTPPTSTCRNRTTDHARARLLVVSSREPRSKRYKFVTLTVLVRVELH